jgi:hypothetical protein
VLELLPRTRTSREVLRFANATHLATFATRKGLTIDEVTNVITFARDDVTKELMTPFERKPKLGNKFGSPSRFSNGEWPVFYAALERGTAEKESTYHYARKAAGDKAARREVHYSVVRCGYVGETIDLVPQLTTWPELRADDYAFCNELGKEAFETALGGFIAPSARNKGGMTVPALLRSTLSGPEIIATVRLSYDTGNTVVEYKDLP